MHGVGTETGAGNRGDPCAPVPTGEVRMPSGKKGRPRITDNKDGTVTVQYSPTEKGLHEMDIKYDGNHIPGAASPSGCGAGFGGQRVNTSLPPSSAPSPCPWALREETGVLGAGTPGFSPSSGKGEGIWGPGHLGSPPAPGGKRDFGSQDT